MEDASRGYGLLLHAFGLRAEKMTAQYSAHIKTIVSLALYSDYLGTRLLVNVINLKLILYYNRDMYLMI